MCSTSELVVKNSLSSLRAVLQEDIVLRQYSFKEYFLVRFLYSSNFQVPTALHKIKEYQSIVWNNPKLFVHSCPSDLIQLKIKDKLFLDGRDRKGRRIFLIKLSEMNLRKTSVEEEILVVNLLAEKVMGESLTLKNGVSVLVDVLNVSWRIMQWVTPHNINLIVKIIENYPVKELIIHVVNKSYLIQIAVNIIWPFLSDHRKELIKFHFNNWASLHEEVDPKVLPAEYGGTGPDLIFKENVLKDADILTEQIKQNMFKRNQLTH